MTQPTKSVRLRRIDYSKSSSPILPVLYEDQQDEKIQDVLDTALAYNGLITVLGYTWNGSKQIRSDYTEPETTITFYPNPSEDSQSTVALLFESSETNSTFLGRLDGAAYVPVTSPLYYTGITTGSHTVDIYATDYLGNVESTPASTTWFTTGTLT